MNDSQEPQKNVNENELERLRDRLADQALREAVGNVTPPDLTRSIIAASQESAFTPVSVHREQEGQKNRAWLAAFAAVACILLLAGVFVATQWVGFDNRQVASASRQNQRRDAAGKTGPIEKNVSASQVVDNFNNTEWVEPTPLQSGAVAAPSEESDVLAGAVANLPTDETTKQAIGTNAGGAMQTAGRATSESSSEYASRVDGGYSRVADAAEGEAEFQSGGAPPDASLGYGGYGGGGGYGGTGRANQGRGRNVDYYFEDTDSESRAFGNDSEAKLRIAVGGNAATRRYGMSGIAPGKDLQHHDAGGDKYAQIHENPFVETEGTQAVSTFSIDVDTASFTNVRQFLLGERRLPPPDAVRIEELINYFDYLYKAPTDDQPFASSIEMATCPWQPKHQLVRIGLKGKIMERHKRPASNLVFLVDVSGSMQDPNKLPLVIEGLKQLTYELNENDSVAIVVYASQEGLALRATRGHQKDKILTALGQLTSGGSTAGGAGIQLAYSIAAEHFIEEGTNRVILCTDGDFNVGVTDTAELERIAEQKAKTGVFLTVLGFGRGNLNDAMMEKISNKGNGNYHYVDNLMEARKVLVREMTGTLVTIAKDVKIQVEFNPARVSSYRLLGYENRMLAREDFEDDKKDAGEIGAGHTVTALYEVVPTGEAASPTDPEPLKYQTASRVAVKSADSQFDEELMELRVRYKAPDGNTSKLLRFPVIDEVKQFSAASEDFRFASAVAGFGLILRNSQHKGNATIDNVQEIATASSSSDEYGYRKEFLSMIECAKELLSATPNVKRRRRHGGYGGY